MWKLDGGMLKDKAGHWKSDESWVFKTEDDDLIYIENTSKTMVLAATSDGKVTQEVFAEGKVEQLWKKPVVTDAQARIFLFIWEKKNGNSFEDFGKSKTV